MVGRGAPTAPQIETFLRDGLALIQRGDERFVNEPHIGGGNPVASSKGTSYFNDALGTTLGANDKTGDYTSASLTAFGENLSHHSPTPTQNSNFFTGKPEVPSLGHAFLIRNYRAGLAKWQTADPLGYPDGSHHTFPQRPARQVCAMSPCILPVAWRLNLFAACCV